MPTKVEQKSIQFKCDHCDIRFSNELDCVNHEKKHGVKDCKHEDMYVNLDYIMQDCDFRIYANCRQCMYKDEVGIPTYDEELMKQIYKLVKES